MPKLKLFVSVTKKTADILKFHSVTSNVSEMYA